eukprot:TRINITY_DN11396_c0_g1::TRINITY_DN11396_c0_g1_i1::g.26408::m.26408 TRINITY_DN11396_c0_g1::TRINITY_DN11396_c0_g1_i1::g.26408  ORF type:complete len:182 (-),score=43.99,sp/Q8RY89/PI5K8_ARATH/48.28/4e-09,PIP5K/PF01504.13/6.5e-16 TRINITY_DN11396_c0_g1_i1:296-790(-)
MVNTLTTALRLPLQLNKSESNPNIAGSHAHPTGSTSNTNNGSVGAGGDAGCHSASSSGHVSSQAHQHDEDVQRYEAKLYQDSYRLSRPVKRLDTSAGIKSKRRDFRDYGEIYFIGIIDTLIEYKLKKKTENLLKSGVYDPSKISIVPPPLYGDRFLEFVEKVIL